MSLLEVKDLEVKYITSDGIVSAVNGINFALQKGECLGLVGETGAGKTTTALSIIRLLPIPPAKIERGEIRFDDTDLLKLSNKEMRRIQGNNISMIFQDPMTALNPIKTVGEQIAEVIYTHQKRSAAEAEIEALGMLEKVGIRAERGKDYPHQFSGGMKQRVVIAIALACNPNLLIADEPTTALDVTIQAQVLEMMAELQQEYRMSMILITHDLGVVSEVCNKVAIMYAGEIVEYGNPEHIYTEACHPYTKGLFASLPSLDKDVKRLQPILGLTPDPSDLPSGCKFHPRCTGRTDICSAVNPEPTEVSKGHIVKCNMFLEKAEV
jgi:peptide/nickel transport system ATP-binding protein